VLSGTAGLVVAGGVQNMSLVPIGSAMSFGGDRARRRRRPGQQGRVSPRGVRGDGSPREKGNQQSLTDPFAGSRGWRERYGAEEISQFRAADLIADKWGITRPEMERYALASHQRAVRAIDTEAFDAEIVPYGDISQDEGPRRDTTLDAMAALKPLRDGGRITAALSSQVADGGAALLIASSRAVREYGLTPRARIVHLSARGDDPVLMLTAPIAATAHALRKAGMSLAGIDLIEINEAFASVVLAWQRETGADLARVNVCGGAIALGHPLGATGARLLTTLVHALARTGGRYGLLTMCEGGGQANVTIIERV
jgi:acetyl-CoA C-acetyltransferase